MNEPVIGIDLGTTFSCVGVYQWDTGRVEIIANEQGNRTTPSVVSFCKTELLVGEGARSKLVTNPENTIYNSKRMIGRQFSDIRKEDLEMWPFTVARTSDDKPRYQVSYQDQGMFVAPEEISAMVLARMKEIAERHVKQTVTKAVITVPAYFTEPQKRATKDAGMLAGLDVLSLLPEPTASALAYGLDQKAMDGAAREKLRIDGWHILVFDLGGGTFDVSVLKLDGQGGFIQKAITGDFHLGGEDFDDLLVHHFLTKILADYPNEQLSKRSLGRLRTECEKVKRVLSTTSEATLEMDLQGIEICYDISRAEFEHVCSELFDCMMGEVKAALELAKLQPKDIDDVVLVGGSTRVPAVRNMLQRYFNGKTLWCGINPDEAVAIGATQYAAALVKSRMPKQIAAAAPATPPAHSLPPRSPVTPSPSGTPFQPHNVNNNQSGASGKVGIALDNVVLTNVTPLTLGIELWNGDMDVLIPRGTQIPAEKTDYYTTGVENQPTVVIKICEGEKPKAKMNSLLGKFSLQVPPAPAGVPKIEVKFEITIEGLFLVSARDLSTGQLTKITIDKANLSQQEKEKMMLNRNQTMAQSSNVISIREARNDLFTYVYGVQVSARNTAMLEVERGLVLHACEDVLRWLESNPGGNGLTREDILAQRKALEAKWEPLRSGAEVSRHQQPPMGGPNQHQHHQPQPGQGFNPQQNMPSTVPRSGPPQQQQFRQVGGAPPPQNPNAPPPVRGVAPVMGGPSLQQQYSQQYGGGPQPQPPQNNNQPPQQGGGGPHPQMMVVGGRPGTAGGVVNNGGGGRPGTGGGPMGGGQMPPQGGQGGGRPGPPPGNFMMPQMNQQQGPPQSFGQAPQPHPNGGYQQQQQQPQRFGR